MRHLLSLASVLCFVSLVQQQQARAQNLDTNAQQALDKTQALLRDPSQRANAAGKDSAAHDADANVSSLTKGNAQQSQEVYEISAEVMENIVKQTNGDPVKLQALLQEAQKNPQAFLNSMSSAQQGKVHSLANQLDQPSQKPDSH